MKSKGKKEKGFVNEFGEEVGNIDEETLREREAEIEFQMKAMMDDLEEEEMAKDPEEGDDDGYDPEDDDAMEEGLYDDEEGLNFDKIGDGEMGIDDEEYERLMQMDKEESDDEPSGNKGKARGQGDLDEGSEMSDDVENEVFEEMREQEANFNENDEQIDRLEQQLVASKPWQMKGEIRAIDRPKNALLDIDVEFDHGVELKEKKDIQVLKNIEEMIKQRILTEAFDDPREVIVDNSLKNPAEKPELDHAKDKKGLASYYEEEYKRKMLGLPLESKEDKAKSEILALFKDLNMHLDYISGLKYSIAPSELKMKDQVAKDIEVIQLEEKVPISFNNALQKNAKQNYESKAKEFLADDEKTHEDNRRIRRIAKRRIRAKVKEQKAKDLQKNLEHKGQSKFEYNITKKAQKKVEHEHENSKVEMTNLTKSKQFFQTLQKRKDGTDSNGVDAAKLNAKKQQLTQKRLKL